MRSLPIVTVSIFLNLGPLLTVVLAVWVLKEKANVWSFVQVAVGFFGVILIMMGDVIEREDNSVQDEVQKSLLYALLALTPLIIALGNFKASIISQHPQIEIHFIPWWVNLLCILIFGTTCLIEQVYLPENPLFWFIAVLSGLSNLFSWHFKVTAYKYDIVSRVSPIAYMESIHAFLIDTLLFGTAFSGQ
jgi:drug/metabolite transporter (DMT)-like permease